MEAILLIYLGTPNLRTPRGVGGTPRVTPQMVGNRTPGGGVFQVPNATPGLPGQPYGTFQVSSRQFLVSTNIFFL